jgi:hypothetical protein
MEREHLLMKGARPYGERAPFNERGAPFMEREHPLMKGARPYGERAPFNERGALVACWVGGLVISSFSFMQLRVDDN